MLTSSQIKQNQFKLESSVAFPKTAFQTSTSTASSLSKGRGEESRAFAPN
jgi:hypothetical protein